MDQSEQPPSLFDKSIVLTPVIAKIEKILYDYQQIKNNSHPPIVKQERQIMKQAEERITTLDNYQKEQTKLYDRECECAVQSANDEYEDFLYSVNARSIASQRPQSKY